MNPTELELNQIIAEIENGLLKGHITTNTPAVALEYHTKLGAYLSMCYGFIERLDTLQAQHHVNAKIEDEKLSDLSISKRWKTSEEGVRQNFWLNRIHRLKVLIEHLQTIYYAGRDEAKLRELK